MNHAKAETITVAEPMKIHAKTEWTAQTILAKGVTAGTKTTTTYNKCYESSNKC